VLQYPRNFINHIERAERYLQLFGIGDDTALNHTNDRELVMLYMKYGANPLAPQNETFISYVLQSQYGSDMLDYILTHYPVDIHKFKVSLYGRSGTLVELALRYTEYIPILLKHGLDCNYVCGCCNHNLLQIADGDPGVVEIILQYQQQSVKN
jgi:hypothetical protein